MECPQWATSVDELFSMVFTADESSAVPSCKALISDDKLETVVRCASIATIYDDAVKLCKAGVVAHLGALLRNGSDMHKLWAAEALKNFSYDDAIRAEMMKKEVIGPLTTLLRVGTDEQKHRTALALGKLAIDHVAKEAIGRKRAIDPLAARVKTGTHIQKQCAAYADGYLAFDAANRAEMVRVGTISGLVALLTTNDVDQQI